LGLAGDRILFGKWSGTEVEIGGEDGSLIVGPLLEKDDYDWGFNAATGEYQDLVGAGVIDPDVGPDLNSHLLSSFSLEKAQLTASLLKMLAQGLRVLGIILCSQGLKGEGRLTTKGHRTNANCQR